mgnify:CR=1 FL=1
MLLSTYLTRLIWLCVMPLAVFSAWLVYDIVGKLQEATDQEAGYIAKNFATAIDQHLNARMGSLKVMASSPLVDDPALWPIYYKVAQGFRDNFGSHVIFTDVSEPMHMLFNTRAPFGSPLPPLPKPKSNAAAPKALATGQPAVSDIFIGPVAKERLVALAVPIRRHDKIPNILVATFETHHFQARLERVALPAGWGLSLVDGQGARLSKNPVGYVLTLALFEPLVILFHQVRLRRRAVWHYFQKHWKLGFLGASVATSAYCIVLWAMTQAPIAVVAALRESSVIFAVLIGAFWFKEGRLRVGLAAALGVAMGVVLIKG